MGTAFSGGLDGNLTESQRRKAKLLGWTHEQMVAHLQRINNMEHPEISVIIPVYNGEKYIKACVESVLAQTFDRFEVIVIDDGSTDHTLDILCQIENITVLIKPNGGTASALNMGIKNARGSWIKWISADDVMYPDCLQKLSDHPKNNNTIYYTHYDIIDSEGKLIDQFIEPVRQESQLWSFFYGNGSSSIIHKDVFKKCGLFDDTLPHSEDYEFWLRASQVHGIKLELIPQITIQYRRHPDQLTNKVGGSLDSLIKNKIKSLIETASSEGKPEGQHSRG